MPFLFQVESTSWACSGTPKHGCFSFLPALQHRGVSCTMLPQYDQRKGSGNPRYGSWDFFFKEKYPPQWNIIICMKERDTSLLQKCGCNCFSSRRNLAARNCKATVSEHFDFYLFKTTMGNVTLKSAYHNKSLRYMWQHLILPENKHLQHAWYQTYIVLVIFN